MSVTVELIYKWFPDFKHNDMIQLTGNKDYKKEDTVSFSCIANYSGKYNKQLSIFVAKQEGISFLSCVSDKDKKAELAKIADVKPDDKENDNNIKQGMIPMGMSIFDIAPKKEGV